MQVSKQEIPVSQTALTQADSGDHEQLASDIRQTIWQLAKKHVRLSCVRQTQWELRMLAEALDVAELPDNISEPRRA